MSNVTTEDEEKCLLQTTYSTNQFSDTNSMNITNTTNNIHNNNDNNNIDQSKDDLTVNHYTDIPLNSIQVNSLMLNNNQQNRPVNKSVNSNNENQYKKGNNKQKLCNDSVTSESSNSTMEVYIVSSSDEDDIHNELVGVNDNVCKKVISLVQEINHLCKSKGYNNRKFRKSISSSRSKEVQHYLNRALLRASCKGTIEHIELLLKAGTSIQATDKYGRSCLHLAAKFGHVKVVEYLLKSALHKAAITRRRRICKNLITSGACPTIRDANGKQPSDLALEAKDPQLATYLKKEEIMFIIRNGVEKIPV
ncbi:Diacylglycerol kinase zeta [Schistosoma japonicum]|nr:Diacylglycerol kinase zeta [Schistosoma japonicum]